MNRILASQCSVLLLAVAVAAADVLPEPVPPTAEPACKSCRDTRRCRACDGTGEQKCSECLGKRKVETRCSNCGGDGRKSNRRKMGRRWVTRTSSCSTCSGKGKKETDCTRCGKDGRVSCSVCRGKKHCVQCFAPSPANSK